jgi:GPH family glycoside/pentoside/hexuronide:cation symporter
MLVKNTALPYFCNWVLGTYNDGITQTMISAIGGIPMGIGLFLVWPLCKKYGKRNVTMAGYAVMILGGIVCLINPRSMPVVLVGQFIKNFGGIPSAYVFAAILGDVLDHVERKNGFRVDGLSGSAINVVNTITAGLCIAIFTGLIGAAGYVAPVADAAGSYAHLTQTPATQNAIIFCFLGLEIITGAILIAILKFLDVEKRP